MTCVILGATCPLGRRHAEKCLVHLAELGLIPCWLVWWRIIVLAEELLLIVQVRVVFVSLFKLALDVVRVRGREMLHHFMDLTLDEVLLDCCVPSVPDREVPGPIWVCDQTALDPDDPGMISTI
jgi:hypothetical protein